MKGLPEQSIDLILCDLPFQTTECEWDKMIPFTALWKEYNRVLKPNKAVVLFGSQPFTTTLIQSNLQDFKYEWIWVKNRPTNFVHSKNKPMKKHENICVFSSGTTVHESQSKDRMPYYPQNLVPIEKTTHTKKASEYTDAFFQQRKSHGEFTREFTNYPHSILEFSTDQEGLHPTAKPVALLEYLIETYTLEGETVLDNTMGSGSTGVATVNTDRKFVGIELDPNYFKIASERILKAKQDQEMVLFK